MALNDTLGTALTAATNPDPNSLTEDTPYTLAESRKNAPFKPSAAWALQGNAALFPVGVKDGSGHMRINLHFVPSGGAAVTYTIVCWFYNPVSDTWSKPHETPSISFTGEERTYIDNAGTDAIFLQISAISAGTLSIYFDPSNARKG